MITIKELEDVAISRGVAITGFALAAAAGFAAGYLYANNRLEEKFDDKLAEELAAAQHVYKVVQGQPFTTPQEAAEALVKDDAEKITQQYQGGPVEGPQRPYLDPQMPREAPPAYQRAKNWTPGVVAGEVPQERRNNIFDDAKPSETDFDYAEEERNRTEEAPYIISQHEHLSNDQEFTQVTLTYYEGDGVLADERDDKIDDIDEMVGNDNIPRFGHRSNDNDTLYVRNHRFGLDMEIIRDHRKYAEVVLGLTAEE